MAAFFFCSSLDGSYSSLGVLTFVIRNLAILFLQLVFVFIQIFRALLGSVAQLGVFLQ